MVIINGDLQENEKNYEMNLSNEKRERKKNILSETHRKLKICGIDYTEKFTFDLFSRKKQQQFFELKV